MNWPTKSFLSISVTSYNLAKPWSEGHHIQKIYPNTFWWIVLTVRNEMLRPFTHIFYWLKSYLIFEWFSKEVFLDDGRPGPQPVGVVLRRFRTLVTPEHAGTDSTLIINLKKSHIICLTFFCLFKIAQCKVVRKSFGNLIKD